MVGGVRKVVTTCNRSFTHPFCLWRKKNSYILLTEGFTLFLFHHSGLQGIRGWFTMLSCTRTMTHLSQNIIHIFHFSWWFLSIHLSVGILWSQYLIPITSRTFLTIYHFFSLEWQINIFWKAIFLHSFLSFLWWYATRRSSGFRCSSVS